MPGRATQYEAQAREAAARIDRARDQGEQLTFLPDEVGGGPVDTLDREAGDRRVRGPGKVVSQLREWLVARGWQLPEDVIGRIAGLDQPGDVVLTTMTQAERLVLWAFDGKVDKDGNPRRPTPEQMLAAFGQLYTARLRAAEALLPYGAPKATPDAPAALAVQVVMAPAAPSGSQARDVTPHGSGGPVRLSDRRVMPADLRAEMERNQRVSGGDPAHSDGAIRTEGPSR